MLFIDDEETEILVEVSHVIFQYILIETTQELALIWISFNIILN